MQKPHRSPVNRSPSPVVAGFFAAAGALERILQGTGARSNTNSCNRGKAIRRFIASIKYGEVARYGVTTIVGYGILYLGAYWLIERAGMPPDVAYMLLLTVLYAGVYVSYTLFVFRERFTAQTLRRFVVALAFMWALNNAFFYLLNQIFAVHYLLVITLNILLFGGVRFCVQRFYVFRSST